MNHPVLDSIDVSVIVSDADGRIAFANKAAHQLVCLVEPAAWSPGPDAMIGRPVGEILELEHPLDALEPGESCRFESRVVGFGGDVAVDVDVHVTAQDVGHVFAFRDVTEDRRLQEEMRRVERLAAIGTMVAGFAHEVRNPVASLRAITEALDEELRERDLRLPHTTRLLEVLGRIERLVKTSLEFGRPATTRPALLAPCALMRSAVAAVAPRTSGVPIHVDAPADLPSIFVDEGQLVQVLVILLNNALDATGSASNVCVRASLDDPPSGRRDGRRISEAPSPPPAERPPLRVRIEVIDFGSGIRADAIGHVFDAFFTTKASGTGLGLAIAQKIVTENGSHLEIASLSQPTIFAVTCPTS